MDELNLQLRLLIQEVCSYAPASRQYRQAVNNMLRVILRSGRIWRPRAGDVYEEICYEEALHKTMFNLTQTVCEKYDPSRGSFLAWFNTCLHNQYRDEIRAVQRDRSRRKSSWQGDEDEFDPLEHVAAPIDGNLLLETWKAFVCWIRNDPDGILQNCHIGSNKKANCQLMAHLRLLEGKEWQEIAREVGSSRGAITSHWCRKCEFLMREWLEVNQRLFGEVNYE
ncbi:MAG: sigma-70 family RNA polymerase sigma factor [Calothrix sp. C42_A2020_038]|nr:sigma-70 family RNA polymerase sigma factor [Calothrix sp. C42_A2020_038]